MIPLGVVAWGDSTDKKKADGTRLHSVRAARRDPPRGEPVACLAESLQGPAMWLRLAKRLLTSGIYGAYFKKLTRISLLSTCPRRHGYPGKIFSADLQSHERSDSALVTLPTNHSCPHAAYQRARSEACDQLQ